jgi:hypothetical protein
LVGKSTDTQRLNFCCYRVDCARKLVSVDCERMGE